MVRLAVVASFATIRLDFLFFFRVTISARDDTADNLAKRFKKCLNGNISISLSLSLLTIEVNTYLKVFSRVFGSWEILHEEIVEALGEKTGGGEGGVALG